MAERQTEPTLTLPESAPGEQIHALADFNAVIEHTPQFVLRVLGRYNANDTSSHPMRIARNRVQSAITGILESDADTVAKPDPATAAGMRRALDQLNRKREADNAEKATVLERRLARLSAYVTERAVWNMANPSKDPKLGIIQRTRLARHELRKDTEEHSELQAVIPMKAHHDPNRHPPSRPRQKKSSKVA